MTTTSIAGMIKARRAAVGVQQAQGHGIRKVSARVEMVRDIVDFFEKEVPAMFHNVIAVVGSHVGADRARHDHRAGLHLVNNLARLKDVRARLAASQA